MDGIKLTASIALTGESVNKPPVATGQSVIVTTDTAKTITLSGTDDEGTTLSFSKVTNPAHGTLGTISTPSCSGTTCTATVVYTPATGYIGTDQFTFRVHDGNAPSFSDTVAISVIPSGDAPWADSMTTWYSPGNARTITLTGGDPNGDDIEFEIVTPPSNGTLSAITAGGCSGTAPLFCDAHVTYTPDSGSEGEDSFTFRTYEVEGSNVSNDATVWLTLSQQAHRRYASQSAPSGAPYGAALVSHTQGRPGTW